MLNAAPRPGPSPRSPPSVAAGIPYANYVFSVTGALLVVNLLGVAIPLQVRSVVNALHAGFSLEAVLRQALLIVTMATVMGLVRLWSRMLVFGVGRQVEADLKQGDLLLSTGMGGVFPPGYPIAEVTRVVRDAATTIADAFERIEAIRAATLASLRAQGLRDLATPQGLKAAGEKLERAMRIALPGNADVEALGKATRDAAQYVVEIAKKHGLAPGHQVLQQLPEGVGRRRAARQRVVDLHHLVDRQHAVERQRQLGVVGHGAVHRLQHLAHVQVVAQRRQAAGDGAGAHGHEHAAVGAEGAQHLHVFCVAETAFDQADVARPHGLDVGQRRAVKFNVFDELEQALVDVQERHVAAKAAGQRDRGHAQLSGGGVFGAHPRVSASSKVR